MECRQLALDALCLREPAAKVAAVHDLWSHIATLALQTDTPLTPVAHAVPGRPDRPPLRSAKAVPNRSVFTPQGMAAMVHAVCHIEFNAINLALDAVWRFAGMPSAYYRDWLRVAHEEATHFGLLQAHLQTHGHAYGDFDAHDGLWAMCEKTADDVLARMALVPRTLEARGLDATPLIQAKLQRANTPEALAVCAARTRPRSPLPQPGGAIRCAPLEAALQRCRALAGGLQRPRVGGLARHRDKSLAQA